MTKREFLDTVFALAPNEANAIMDAFDEYVESNVVPTGRSGKERRMSKYIIEIPDDVQYVLFNGKADNKYYTAVRPIAELEELNSDYINENFGELQDEAYKRGHDDGYKKCLSENDFDQPCVSCDDYQAGLDKAWEIVRRIRLNCYDGGIDSDGLRKIFGTANNYTIIKENTAQEAIDKIKAYDGNHSDRIEVGDEVVFETEGAEPFVILHKYYDDASYPSEYRYSVYAQNGEVLTFNEGDGPKKTGRHFQEINKLLEEMKNTH